MRIVREDDLAIVHLEAGKANAISAEFLKSLSELVAALEADLPRGVVMTGKGRAFSAGLDIPSLLELDRAGMGAHMRNFNAIMRRIFVLACPVVAAVNGHAIAGGCVLAMQADERIMGREGLIGLNEVTLGIGLPTFVLESFALQVGSAAVHRGALGGELFAPEAALGVGIVHAIAEADGLLPQAMARARGLAALGSGFTQVKAMVRRPVLERTDQHGADDDERWLDTWFSEHAQAQLRAVAERLAR